ncbi:MAG: toprim domain-containing protein [Candidatus Shikimatogenerans bostrichidophilus]|nr:MAG: toprim domain-containing protein [Candidatus Shikimatogenerans bostrichidophilus]
MFLKKKGFNEKIIKKFLIGYSSSYNELYNFFLKNKFFKIKKKIILKSGLFIIKNNKILDFFRNRIMFPIKNLKGEIVGFGARTLNTYILYNKYINTPNNLIYNKSKILYGLFEAKKYIIKYNFCYIVEGYTDLILLHQYNIKNVLSISGTSISKYQVEIIKNYTKNIIFLYDGDKAGIDASFRNINIFLNYNFNIRFYLFKKNEDPNYFLRKNGNKIKNINIFFKKNSINFIDLKIKFFKNKFNDQFKKYLLIKDIILNIYNISNKIIKIIYLQYLSRKFRIKIKYIYKELNKLKKKEDKNKKKKFISNINYVNNKNKIYLKNKNYFFLNQNNNYINDNINIYDPIKNIEKILIKKIISLKKFINKFLIFKFKNKKKFIDINKIIINILINIKKYNIFFNKKNKKIIDYFKKKTKKFKKNYVRKNIIINTKKKKKISNKIISSYFKSIILKYKYFLLSNNIEKYSNLIKQKKSKNKKKNLMKIFFLLKKKKKIEKLIYDL